MLYIVQRQKWNWGAFEPGQELLFANSFAGERLDTSRTSFAHVHAGTCQSGHFILIGDRVFQWVFEKNVFLRENCERKLLFLRISNIQSKAIFAEGSDMLIIMLKLKWWWQIQWYNYNDGKYNDNDMFCSMLWPGRLQEVQQFSSSTSSGIMMLHLQ